MLGVKPTASIREIRAAHRTMVRKLHPDADGLETAEYSAAFAAVTAAWEVLGDPVRRREYDESLIVRVEENSERNFKRANIDDLVEDYEPEFPQVIVRASFPWKFMLVSVVVGVILVLFLHSSATTEDLQRPDSLIQSGSCVMIDPTEAVYEVSCDAPNDGVVRQLIGFDRTCPSDTFGYRDRQGMGIACLEP
ncbi:MAG: DnaJ domain-containing protein [Actinomycetota bacterium]|nr:DnaJ domain-containing protein [Actinomycetota bacterium]